MDNRVAKPALSIQPVQHEHASPVTVDVNYADHQGDTALHRACRAYLVEPVQRLLEIPGINIYTTNSSGATALHTIFRKQFSSPKRAILMTQLILAKSSAGINYADNLGCTALDYLFEHMNSLKPSSFLELLKLLLQNGADPNRTNTDDANTLLHQLVYYSPLRWFYADNVDIARQDLINYTIFSDYVENEIKITFPSILVQLVSAGANLNATNNLGKRVLDQIAEWLQPTNDKHQKQMHQFEAFVYITLLQNNGEIPAGIKETNQHFAGFGKLAQFKRESQELLALFSEKSLYRLLLSNDEASAMQVYGSLNNAINQGERLEQFAVTHQSCSRFFSQIKNAFTRGRSAWRVAIEQATEVMLATHLSKPYLPPNIWRKIFYECNRETLLAVELLTNKSLGDSLLTACAGADQVMVALILQELRARTNQLAVNQCDGNGNTALHIACSRGSIELVTLLIDALGMDLEKTNNQGKTAFDIVRESSSVEAKLIRPIFTQKKLNAQVTGGNPIMTPLQLACLINEPRLVEQRLTVQEGRNEINIADSYGLTPLHTTCFYPIRDRAEQIIRLLLYYCPDININALSPCGQTRLYSACLHYLENKSRSKTALEIIRLFLQHPLIQVHTPNNNVDRDTPIRLALLRNNKQLIETLLTVSKIHNDQLDVEGNTALHLACMYASVYESTTETLLKSPHVDVNRVNKHGDTALHLAAHHLAAEGKKVKLLLQKEGIDVNRCNARGNTALHELAKATCDSPFKKHSYSIIARLLVLEHGIKPTVKNKARQTALDLAVVKKNDWGAQVITCLTLLTTDGTIESEFPETTNYLNTTCNKKVKAWTEQFRAMHLAVDLAKKQGKGAEAFLSTLQTINFNPKKILFYSLSNEQAFRSIWDKHFSPTTPTQPTKNTDFFKRLTITNLRTEKVFCGDKVALKRTVQSCEKNSTKKDKTKNKIAKFDNDKRANLATQVESMPLNVCDSTFSAPVNFSFIAYSLFPGSDSEPETETEPTRADKKTRINPTPRSSYL